MLIDFYSMFLDVDDIVVSVFSLSEDCQGLQAVSVLHHHHLVASEIALCVHHHQLVAAHFLLVGHLQLQPQLNVSILTFKPHMISWEKKHMMLLLTCSTTATVPGAMATMEVTALWASELNSVICWRILTAPAYNRDTHLPKCITFYTMVSHVQKHDSVSPKYLCNCCMVSTVCLSLLLLPLSCRAATCASVSCSSSSTGMYWASTVSPT